MSYNRRRPYDPNRIPGRFGGNIGISLLAGLIVIVLIIKLGQWILSYFQL